MTNPGGYIGEALRTAKRRKQTPNLGASRERDCTRRAVDRLLVKARTPQGKAALNLVKQYLRGRAKRCQAKKGGL